MKNKKTNFMRDRYYRRLVLKPRNRLDRLLPFDVSIRLGSNYSKFYTDKYYKIKFKRLGREYVYYALRRKK